MVCRPNAVSHAIGYALHRCHSHDAVIRGYDTAGNVIETHEHAGEFKDWLKDRTPIGCAEQLDSVSISRVRVCFTFARATFGVAILTNLLRLTENSVFG